MKLTRSEHLLVYRRRKGWSQRDAAEEFGVSLYQFRAWEQDADRGEYEFPKGITVKALAPHEKAVIKRIRAGLTASDLAQQLGVSRFWLSQMERGVEPCERLVDYWRIR